MMAEGTSRYGMSLLELQSHKGRTNRCRETVKRVLSLPADTNIIWKSHDDSITQRSVIDQARQEKTVPHIDGKRRNTTADD